tara:strand:- start:17 stop:859 length:843 start_codon:yes stop_codon:yes gene_type:complete
MEKINFSKYKTIQEAINHAENLMKGSTESKIHAHNLISTAIYDLPNSYNDKSAHKLGHLREQIWKIEKSFGWNPKFTSQSGQDKIIYDNFFRNYKIVGFFVDIGAYDGRLGSNSFFFEKFLGWKGIAIEPSKKQYNKLLQVRNCLCLNEAVTANKSEVEFCDVIEGPTMMSGIKNISFENNLKLINNVQDSEINTYKIETISFATAVGDKKNIDYLSIDIEGGEKELIESIDYNTYDIKIISIENNSPNNINYNDFLTSQGFNFFNSVGHDEIYFNKKHF